jgi:hypothetical protein
MNQITYEIENKIREQLLQMEGILKEAEDIEAAYWDTDANTKVAAKADTDPVTVTTKLWKTDYLGGITLCGELQKFFNNTAITAADNLQRVNNVLYGHAEAASILSPATEDIGNRLKAMCIDIGNIFDQCLSIVELFYDNQIGTALGSLSSERIVYGATESKSVYTSGISILEQFRNLLKASAVTTADYRATLSNWHKETLP